MGRSLQFAVLPNTQLPARQWQTEWTTLVIHQCVARLLGLPFSEKDDMADDW